MARTRVKAVPFTQFREGLAGYVDRCSRFGERITVSRHARDVVVLISRAEWDEIAETLSVIGDPQLFRQLVKSEQDIKSGRVRPAREVFAELDSED